MKQDYEALARYLACGYQARDAREKRREILGMLHDKMWGIENDPEHSADAAALSALLSEACAADTEMRAVIAEGNTFATRCDRPLLTPDNLPTI